MTKEPPRRYRATRVGSIVTTPTRSVSKDEDVQRGRVRPESLPEASRSERTALLTLRVGVTTPSQARLMRNVAASWRNGRMTAATSLGKAASTRAASISETQRSRAAGVIEKDA